MWQSCKLSYKTASFSLAKSNLFRYHTISKVLAKILTQSILLYFSLMKISNSSPKILNYSSRIFNWLAKIGQRFLTISARLSKGRSNVFDQIPNISKNYWRPLNISDDFRGRFEDVSSLSPLMHFKLSLPVGWSPRMSMWRVIDQLQRILFRDMLIKIKVSHKLN